MQRMHCRTTRPTFRLSVVCAAGLMGVFLGNVAAPARADAAVSVLPQPITLTVPQITATPPRLPANCPISPTALIPKPFDLNLRLGVMVSPSVKFAGGADIGFSFGILPGFSSRVDAEAIVSANFARVSTLIPVTFDQIYSKSLPGVKVYVGGGIGPYFGEVTRFGGKLFVGAGTSGITGELGVHFSGGGDPLVIVSARVPL